MIEERKVKEFYDSVAELYDLPGTLYDEDLYMIYEREIRSIEPPGDLILDIGCGTGFPGLIFLAEKGKDVCFLDVSAEMLRILRDKIRKTGIEMRRGGIILASADRLPIRSGIFDMTFSIGGVINHLKFFHEGIKEMLRILRSNGMFMLEFENWKCIDTLWRVIGIYGKDAAKKTIRELLKKDEVKIMEFVYSEQGKDFLISQYYFSVNVIRRLLSDQGGKILRMQGMHVFAPLIPPRFLRKARGFLLRAYLKIMGKLEDLLCRNNKLSDFGESIIIIGKKK
ncbi:MAG: class I SAM-dependent methyltransferase [Candidatus Baldrarchaeia archaeon]